MFMSRTRFAFIAALLGATVAVTSLLAQTPKAPEFKSILANRKVEPPFKGQADVEFMASSKRNGDVVTTTMRVKNLSPGPLQRLTVAETWFDKSNNIVAGGQGSLDKMLEPGTVETLTIQTQWNAKMNGNGWAFTHANGTVKPKKVTSIAEPAKPGSAAKAPAKK
jgi:hypothetical protein